MQLLHWVSHTHLSHSHWNDQEYLHNLWALSTQPVWLWSVTRFENEFSDNLHQMHTHSVHRACKKWIPFEIKQRPTLCRSIKMHSKHASNALHYLSPLHSFKTYAWWGCFVQGTRLNAVQSKTTKLHINTEEGSSSPLAFRSACWSTFTERNYCLK